ncbi:MAG: HEAT repeat domain-containing protein [Planctomycetes bacterium]|nr:HEAT repeat domain-containing protein [Planctomycetota bacterium]
MKYFSFFFFLIFSIVVYLNCWNTEGSIDVAVVHQQNVANDVVSRSQLVDLPNHETSLANNSDLPSDSAKDTKLPFHNPRDLTSRISALWKNHKGDEPTYKEKLKSVTQLGINLSENEQLSLVEYLKKGPLKDRYDLHIMDEVMRAIEKQNQILPEYLSQLLNIVGDPNYDGELRGYIMQHLRSAYHDNEACRPELRECFYHSLKDIKTDVSGTALLNIVALNQTHGEFDLDLLKNELKDIINSDDVHGTNLVTAISVIGSLRYSEALPEVRRFTSEGKDTHIKIASIYTLGHIGEESDLEILKELSSVDNQLIQKAATKARRQLENHLSH